MRASSIVLLLLALLLLSALAIFAVVSGSWTSGDVSPGPAGPTPGPGAKASAAVAPTPAPQASSGGGVVATRTLASSPSAEGLAEQPTACIQVVDREGERPVAGASVRRVQNGAELVFTDENGLASVPLRQAEQLAVVADGYLLRLAPTQLGSTEQAPQRVLLVRDAWSIRRRFEFATPDGALEGDAFVRFRPREAGAPPSAPPMSADAVVQRAWTEHTMLAGLSVCADVPVQLGVFKEEHVHRLQNLGEVRFVAPGEFTIEVATAAGFVANQPLVVDRAQAEAIVRVALVPGHFVRGTVTGLGTGEALADAKLILQGGDPLGLVGTTGADGAFRLGPLVPGQITLHVRHGDHLPLAFGPVRSDQGDVRIPLQPLPQSTLRGRVRTRPELRPLAGAAVTWAPQGGRAVTTTSGEDGTFVLQATGNLASRLLVTAPGYVAYAELVAPGSAFADYDLWPGAPEDRVQKGLTALLRGIVVDAEGRAQANVAVRWVPAQRSAATAAPGRRVLDGGTLALPAIVTTGPDGAFQVETDQFGRGHVALASAGPTAAGGVATEAVAGAVKDGLRLQQ